MAKGTQTAEPGVSSLPPRPASAPPPPPLDRGDGTMTTSGLRPPGGEGPARTDPAYFAGAVTIHGTPHPGAQVGFQRASFGGMLQKLAARPRPGFHRHWFNDPPDKPGRIDDAYNAGYTHVADRTSGKPISRVVNRGGERAYLMEIPVQWYDADMAIAREGDQRVQNAIIGGKLARRPGDGRYVPKDSRYSEEDEDE